MIWWWSKDERGEELMNAQEIYAAMMSVPNRKIHHKRDALIEGVEKFLSVAGVTAA